MQTRRLFLTAVLDESGLDIQIEDLPVWARPEISLGVPPEVSPQHVAVYRRREKKRRQARTVREIEALLLWLGRRQDGECRQVVLAEEAVARRMTSSIRQFNRLLGYAVEDGYLERHPLETSSGGRPTHLLDWTVPGEIQHRSLALTLPHPTFYRQAIKRHKSASQVYLALETRDWLVRTGQVLAASDVWMFPTRRQIQSARGEGERFLYDPDIVAVRPDGTLLVVELEVGSFGPTQAWYSKWYELGHQRGQVGVVTTTAARMRSLMAAISRWRDREPDAPRQARFLFSNLQDLGRRAAPGAQDPLPPGTFWLAELVPAK